MTKLKHVGTSTEPASAIRTSVVSALRAPAEMSAIRTPPSWIFELPTASASISGEPTASLAISGDLTPSLRICGDPTLSRGSVTAAAAVPPNATNKARLAVTLA